MSKKRGCRILLCISLIVVSCSAMFAQAIEKPIVVIIPSYNNEKWVEQNLSSILTQKYSNFRIIYIDDCSSDSTLEIARQVIEKSGQQEKVTLIHNSQRCGALANLYTAIHSCQDNAIIVTVDGDDWLPHNLVLAYLNMMYCIKDIWITYGQFIEYPSCVICREYSLPFSDEVIKSNSFRKVGQLPMSHLRTFYAWLFKAIKLEDFLYEENFYTMSWDKTMMACMIEMAGKRHFCTPEVLYVYNNHNPISDHRVDQKLQRSLGWYILSLPPYRCLQRPISYEVDENIDTVSMIFLSNKPVDQLLIERIELLAQLYQSIIVVHSGHDSFDYVDQNLGIKFISYAQSTCKDRLENIISSLNNRYILLCNDLSCIETSIDVNNARALLKRTQTSIFYMSGQCAGFNQQVCLKALPCINHQLSAYAWFPKNKNGSSVPPVLDMTLWGKEALQKAISTLAFSSLEQLNEQLACWVESNNILGLLVKSEDC